jgi:hypothetical protein
MIAFTCQQSPWRREPAFRRILVRVKRPGQEPLQVSILTSHPAMAVADVVWTMFRRWLQENDFKYLDTHFGLNQLTSRDSLSFREAAGQFRDRPVECLEYRELRDSLKKLETKLGGKLVGLRKAVRQDSQLHKQQRNLAARTTLLTERLKTTIDCIQADKQMPRGAANLDVRVKSLLAQLRLIRRKRHAKAEFITRLKAETEELDRSIEPLEQRLCEALRRQSKLQFLAEEDYQILDPRKKAVMDGLRISAANIFRNVQEQFRAIYNNFRDDHMLLRMISRCSGSVIRTDHTLILRIWLPGTLQP